MLIWLLQPLLLIECKLFEEELWWIFVNEVFYDENVFFVASLNEVCGLFLLVFSWG